VQQATARIAANAFGTTPGRLTELSRSVQDMDLSPLWVFWIIDRLLSGSVKIFVPADGSEQALDAERQGCETLMTGARGPGALHSTLLGSVSPAVLHASKVPVTITKRAEVDAAHCISMDPTPLHHRNLDTEAEKFQES